MMNFNDQDPMAMGTPKENNSPSPTYATSSKIMITAIAVLFFVVILMVFLHLYARWYLLRARRRHIRRRNRRATMVFFTAADPSSAVIATRGLDPAVVKSLPVFTFSDATHKDPIECTVCLSDFEETESGRVLPGCKHTFHVDCIDMWFHSHSTCPLCRSLVEPHAGCETLATTTEEEEQVVITISPEPVSETEPGSSSGLRDEPRDLAGKPAAIEVPRRNFSEFEHGSSQNSPFRSPMSRMLSFTRMLSRDRRNASSPIAGASPSPRCHIPMPESDIERGGEQTM
ncbi:RING-H2 finger protein ATL2 [Hirschfeldia incana]|nr:RING-H2 finger protein ATL2 [Hirschfeldia incana]